MPLMEKLTTGRTAALLSPALDDPTDWRPVFDWTSVINLGETLRARLDGPWNQPEEASEPEGRGGV